jgi:phospholipid transport system substrate-binding protein
MRTLFTRSPLLLAGLLLLGLAVLPAQAQTSNSAQEEIRQLLQQRDQEIKRVLGDRDTFTDTQREQLKALINDDIDFEAMGRTALGPFWDDLTAAQREEFVTVFGDIVRAQSLSDLGVYRSKVTYDAITVEGDSARVVTTTVYRDTPTEVIYAMSRTDEGSWDVDDIILDGVSTAEGYARSFQTVMRKKGFDALMNSLHKKRDKMQASE